MSKLTKALLVLCGVVILIVFRNWFTPGLITAGDLWPFSGAMYQERDLPLKAWDQFANNGFGSFSGPFLWIHLNFAIPITIFGQLLGQSWSWIERIGYFLPFLIICPTSSILLYKKIFPKSALYPIAGLLYLLNTYILMIIGGGQIAGIGMAYALAPLVLLFWIRLIEGKSFQFTKSLPFALLVSLQLMYDLRITYVTLAITGIYFLFSVSRKNIRPILLNSILAGVATLLLNAYWLVPSIFIHQDPFSTLGSEYSSLDAVRFFSFAKIENTISLLHPNWPENIFGMTSFLKPEFLLLPILAFSSLLFLPEDKLQRKNILFLATVALIGIFLAKGTQEPFSIIYINLFKNFPGFVLFRDPTKWMVAICIAYTLLIPHTLDSVYSKLKEKYK